MTSLTESFMFCNNLQCKKTNQNERETSQWRLLEWVDVNVDLVLRIENTNTHKLGTCVQNLARAENRSIDFRSKSNSFSDFSKRFLFRVNPLPSFFKMQ